MKRIICVLFIAVILLCPTPSGTQEGGADRLQRGGSPLPPEGQSERPPSQEETILPYPYDQSIMAPRFFLKTLPPLGKKEKVIWSFRTAKANIFL